MNTPNLIKHLFVLCILSFGFAQAQTTAEGWSIEHIHGPSQVGIVDTIPVDINMDDLMDVVSVSIEDGHLRAYVNQGNSAFEQQYISTEVLGAFRVSATDLNADTQTDFLIPSIETNEIIALIADPTSQPYGYRKQIIAAGVLLPTDAQAGDFNNDGLMDVVSLSFEENLLLLHTQNTPGNFNTTVLSTSPQRPRKLLVEDFNNDQRLDILLASSEDNSVRLFSNQDDNSFTEISVSNQLTGIRYLAKCDLLATGYPDFVAGVYGDNQVVLFNNLENNVFASQVIDDDLPGASVVQCADIDGDSVLELISVSSTLGNIYNQEISSPFNKQLVANTRDGYVTAYVASFAADAGVKIITQAFFQQRNLLYTPNQNNQEIVIWEDFPDGAYELVLGDMDNDLDMDVVYVSFRDNLVYWSENKISHYTNHIISAEVEGPQSVSLGDVDGDGDLDVITAGAFDDTFWLHTNNNLSFATQPVLSDANNAAKSQITDMNNDGLMDLVLTSSLDDSLRILYGESGTFRHELISSDVIGALELLVYDFDGNQFSDIVVSGFRDNRVFLFLNQDGDNYSQQIIYDDAFRVSKMAVYDINKDGLMDINLVSDLQHVNLIQSGSGRFVFEPSPLLLNPIVDFNFSLSMADTLDGSWQDGGLFRVKIMPLMNQLIETLNYKFQVRKVKVDSTKHAHYGVSSQSNFLLKLQNDGIFKNGFDSTAN
jgi:hypothetical protein